MIETTYEQANNDVSERQYVDRRRFSWRTIVYGMLYSRRRGARRDIDAQGMQSIDVHGPFEFLMAMSVMLLCICDTYFTLELIGYGAVEANPLMNYLLQIDAMLFYVVKYIGTAIALVFILSLKRFTLFRFVRGIHILVLSVIVYGQLISYQLEMLDEIVLL